MFIKHAIVLALQNLQSPIFLFKDCDGEFPQPSCVKSSNVANSSKTITLQMLLNAGILQPGKGAMSIEYLVRAWNTGHFTSFSRCAIKLFRQASIYDVQLHLKLTFNIREFTIHCQK